MVQILEHGVKQVLYLTFCCLNAGHPLLAEKKNPDPPLKTTESVARNESTTPQPKSADPTQMPQEKAITGQSAETSPAETSLPQFDQGTVGELNLTQQQILLLQSQLELQKLRKEFQKLNGPSTPATNNYAVAAKALRLPDHEDKEKTITVNSIYGSNKGYLAQVVIDGTYVMEVQKGDLLPTGEKIAAIDAQSIVLENGTEQKKIFL